MKLSLRKLAKIAGVDNNTVFKWIERGLIRPYLVQGKALSLDSYDHKSMAILVVIGSMSELKGKNKGICLKSIARLAAKAKPNEHVFTMCFKGLKSGHPSASFISPIDGVPYCERVLCDLK